jgi:hypothetical protein
MGIATWQEKYEAWLEGVKLLFVFILYNAIPFFMFSSGFFLTTLNTFTAFFGQLMIKAAVIRHLSRMLFLSALRFHYLRGAHRFQGALEFEDILRGIREVLVEYIIGYAATIGAVYVALLFMHIPYLIGFLISSVLTYYVLLLSAFFFTNLYRRTSLCMQRVAPEEEGSGEAGIGPIGQE